MLLRYCIALLLISMAQIATANSTLKFQITDRNGNAVSNAVISIKPTNPSHLPLASDPATAEMVQQDRSFVPFVLPIQTNTPVVFPNKDQFQHHVYSFSPTKRFELKLYSGVNTTPIIFENPGVVTLGCNIHDWMLSYIVVVDTPYFQKTSIDGSATFLVPPDTYWIDIWHPQSRQTLKQSVVLKANTQEMIPISLHLTGASKPEIPDEDHFNFDYSPF